MRGASGGRSGAAAIFWFSASAFEHGAFMRFVDVFIRYSNSPPPFCGVTTFAPPGAFKECSRYTVWPILKFAGRASHFAHLRIY